MCSYLCSILRTNEHVLTMLMRMGQVVSCLKLPLRHALYKFTAAYVEIAVCTFKYLHLVYIFHMILYRSNLL